MTHGLAEILDYDAAAKEKRNRPAAWVARWLLEKRDDAPFSAGQIRHEMGRRLVGEANLTMPDVDGAIRKFKAVGMIEPVHSLKQSGSPTYYTPVASEGWEPYTQFLAEHIAAHPEEFAATDARVSVEA